MNMDKNGKRPLLNTLPPELRNEIYQKLPVLADRHLTYQPVPGRLTYHYHNPIVPLAATNKQFHQESKPFLRHGETEPVVEVHYNGNAEWSPQSFGPEVVFYADYSPSSGPPENVLRKAATVEIHANLDDDFPVEYVAYFTVHVFRAYVNWLAVQQMRWDTPGIVPGWPEPTVELLSLDSVGMLAPLQPIPKKWEYAILQAMNGLVHPRNRIQISGVGQGGHHAKATELTSACEDRYQNDPLRWFAHVLLMCDQEAKRLRAYAKHDWLGFLPGSRHRPHGLIELMQALERAMKLLHGCDASVQIKLIPERHDLINHYFAAVLNAAITREDTPVFRLRLARGTLPFDLNRPIAGFLKRCGGDINGPPPAWLDAEEKWLAARHIHLALETPAPANPQQGIALRDRLVELMSRRMVVGMPADHHLHEDISRLNLAIETNVWGGGQPQWSCLGQFPESGFYPWIKVVPGEKTPRIRFQLAKLGDPIEEKHLAPRWDCKGANKVRKSRRVIE